MCGVLLEGHIKWTTAIIWRRYQERKRFIKIILVPYFAHRVFKNMASMPLNFVVIKNT